MNNELLEQALWYAQEKNWYVFPCREKYEGQYLSKKTGRMEDANPKQPRISGGLLNATTDEEQIKKWWTRKGWEDSAIGINCGLSKIFTIDVDTHDVNGFDNFMNLNINLDGTYQSLTANNGLHVIFYDPDGLGKTNSDEETGIDTRGVGGYIVAPPSFIISDSGEKKIYRKLSGWESDFPKQLSKYVLESLGQVKKEKKSDRPKVVREVNNQEIKKLLDQLPEKYLTTYNLWVNVGMALRSLGDEGFLLWENWTEKYFDKKPESRRVGTLKYKWKTFFEDYGENKIDIGSLYYWVKKERSAK